jgi:prophage antirepressor-like protein
MNLLEYKNSEFSVRTITIDGEPWFVAKDVCDIVGLANSRKAVESLHDDERSSVTISDGTSGNPNHTIINESGVYALIFKSRKAEAQAFRRWVTSEVLPAIRRDGYYRMLAIDRQRVSEVAAQTEGAKKKFVRSLEHLYRVQEVPGNISIKAYLLAIDEQLTPRESMQLGARLRYRCKVYGDPVGKARQRRRRTDLPAKTNRAGWHLISTFPPAHIAAELTMLGCEKSMPSPSALAEAEQRLAPPGHWKNPLPPSHRSVYAPEVIAATGGPPLPG